MIERVCPQCDAGNPDEHVFCGRCGAALEPHAQPLARRQASALARRSVALPVPLKQTGKVVALGIATLAAEAGLAWLQRRQQSGMPVPRVQPQRAQVVAFGRRVSETWINGQLQHRTDEQIVWVAPDDSRR